MTLKSKTLLPAIVLLFAAGCFKPASEVRFKAADNPVVAHRGAWKKRGLPENSIVSLRTAIELGCAGSEFDVRMTADDSLVINHDPAYNEMSIEKTNYADLVKFPLSNGEKLPTLREYLRAGMSKNQHTLLVCEIKPSETSKERGQLIAEKVWRLVHALKVQSRVVYISFDYDILKKILQLEPGAPTQYLEGNQNPDQLKADGVRGADYHFSVFHAHPEWIEMARKNKIILNAWTVNEAQEMDWLLRQGFDFITTNEPELALEKNKIKGL